MKKIKPEDEVTIRIFLLIFHIAAFGFIVVIIIENDWESLYGIIKGVVACITILIGGIINIHKIRQSTQKGISK